MSRYAVWSPYAGGGSGEGVFFTVVVLGILLLYAGHVFWLVAQARFYSSSQKVAQWVLLLFPVLGAVAVHAIFVLRDKGESVRDNRKPIFGILGLSFPLIGVFTYCLYGQLRPQQAGVWSWGEIIALILILAFGFCAGAGSTFAAMLRRERWPMLQVLGSLVNFGVLFAAWLNYLRVINAV